MDSAAYLPSESGISEHQLLQLLLFRLYGPQAKEALLYDWTGWWPDDDDGEDGGIPLHKITNVVRHKQSCGPLKCNHNQFGEQGCAKPERKKRAIRLRGSIQDRRSDLCARRTGEGPSRPSDFAPASLRSEVPARNTSCWFGLVGRLQPQGH